MKIPKERFKDVTSIVISTRYVESTDLNNILDHSYSGWMSEEEFEEFLSEYVKWRKEEKNKLDLPDGWYSALNYSGIRYSVYIKYNQQHTPWLGNIWKEHTFGIKKDDKYWSDYKKLPYGKLDEWEVADRFVTTLNERNPQYWEVPNEQEDEDE